MKNFDSRTLLLCIGLVLITKFSFVSAAPQVDSINITIYADCRDYQNLKGTQHGADSAWWHDSTQFASYDPAVLYLTGHWTHPTTPGGSDWTFIEMDSVAPDIFKATFHYAAGQYAGGSGFSVDGPGWYFCPTNDWSTNEWVPGPCNLAWGCQRVFNIDVNKTDTVVAFKYGVCGAEPIADLGLVTGINDIKTTEMATIFPNPASDFITLKNIGSAYAVKIIDFTGKVVKEIYLKGMLETTVSISSLPSQLYLVQFVYADGSMSTTKLVKK